jgi:hypothetical protein
MLSAIAETVDCKKRWTTLIALIEDHRRDRSALVISTPDPHSRGALGADGPPPLPSPATWVFRPRLRFGFGLSGAKQSRMRACHGPRHRAPYAPASQTLPAGWYSPIATPETDLPCTARTHVDLDCV